MTASSGCCLSSAIAAACWCALLAPLPDSSALGPPGFGSCLRGSGECTCLGQHWQPRAARMVASSGMLLEYSLCGSLLGLGLGVELYQATMYFAQALCSTAALLHEMLVVSASSRLSVSRRASGALNGPGRAKLLPHVPYTVHV